MPGNSCPSLSPDNEWHLRGPARHKQCYLPRQWGSHPGHTGGWRIEDQSSGELRASSPYILNCAHRCGSNTPTQGPASGVLVKPKARTELQACLACERSRVPSPPHTKTNSHQEKAKPFRVCKPCVLSVSCLNEGGFHEAGGRGGRRREALSPCAGDTDLGLPCMSTLLIEPLRLTQL